MYLAARLKNSKREWTAGGGVGMQGDPLFVSWNPKLGGRTTGFSLIVQYTQMVWSKWFGFFFFLMYVFLIEG